MAALSWALGLSLEKVVNLFTAFGVSLSRTTVWRDGQEVMSFLPEGKRARMVRVLGKGQEGLWIDDHQGGVVIVLELKRGKKVMLEMIGEPNPDVVQNWLEPIASELGLEMDVF